MRALTRKKEGPRFTKKRKEETRFQEKSSAKGIHIEGTPGFRGKKGDTHYP